LLCIAESGRGYRKAKAGWVTVLSSTPSAVVRESGLSNEIIGITVFIAVSWGGKVMEDTA
jgi:hypothetical protein